MTTRLLASAFLLALVAPLSAAPPDRSTVERTIDAALESWHVPGAAVVITDGEQTLYLAGRGVREKGKPDLVTPDTLFPLASVGKAFTTTLFAIAVDQKKLDWDDPVRKHLPSFHLSDPLADGDVRLRDLLSHRTGVAPHDLLWYHSPLSQDELIERVGKLPLSQPFRTTMQYQSIMYMAAGRALEKATGTPWGRQVREQILRPLEMVSTVLTTDAALRKPDRAAAHMKRDGESVSIPWYEMREPNAAGSIASCARDLAPWLRLHLNGGMHGDKRIVSEANLNETHSPQTIIRMDSSTRKMHPFTKQMSYGMAWVIQDYRGEKLVSHAGVIDGFRIHVTLLPERKIGIAILANLDGTRMNLALSNTLIDQLIGAPPKDWNTHYGDIIASEQFEVKIQAKRAEQSRRRNTRPSLALEKFAGEYEEPAYGVAKVMVNDGELVLQWSSFTAKLRHWEDDTFKAEDEEIGKDPVAFEVKDGKCVSLRAVGMNFRRK